MLFLTSLSLNEWLISVTAVTYLTMIVTLSSIYMHNLNPSLLNGTVVSEESRATHHLQLPREKWEWLVATVGEPEGDEQCECDQSIASHKGRAGSDWLMPSRTNNNTSRKLSYSISSSEGTSTNKNWMLDLNCMVSSSSKCNKGE